MRQALDLSAEWDAVSSTPLPMGCIVARREFVEEHPGTNPVNDPSLPRIGVSIQI